MSDVKTSTKSCQKTGQIVSSEVKCRNFTHTFGSLQTFIEMAKKVKTANRWRGKLRRECNTT